MRWKLFRVFRRALDRFGRSDCADARPAKAPAAKVQLYRVRRRAADGGVAETKSCATSGSTGLNAIH